MRFCPICGKTFSIFQRLVNKDDEHYDQCLIKKYEKRVSLEKDSKRLFNKPLKNSFPKQDFVNPTPHTQYVNQHHHRSSDTDDFLTGALVGYAVSSLFDDNETHQSDQESPQQPGKTIQETYESVPHISAPSEISFSSSDISSSFSSSDCGSSSCDCGGGGCD